MTKRCSHYVYIIQDKHNTLYTGYTVDITQRLESHRNGTGAKYLRGRSPLQLVYLKRYSNVSTALRAEWKIKQLSRLEKQMLIKKADRVNNKEGLDQSPDPRHLSRREH